MPVNSAFFVNRRNSEHPLSLFTMKNFDIDSLLRNNLKRLIDSTGMKQNRLAETVGVHPSVINDILAGRRPMGKDTMARLCRALDVEPVRKGLNDAIVRKDTEKHI